VPPLHAFVDRARSDAAPIVITDAAELFGRGSSADYNGRVLNAPIG